MRTLAPQYAHLLFRRQDPVLPLLALDRCRRRAGCHIEGNVRTVDVWVKGERERLEGLIGRGSMDTEGAG